MTDKYSFAGRVVKVTSLYRDVHDYCSKYRCDGKTDIEVSICQADIDFERERSKRTALNDGRKENDYSDGYLEELAVYRKICEQMPMFDTFLFHGSCIAVDGVGYLFSASSGTGKSTHARLWRKYLGSRAVMVNDDKPLIRIDKEGAVIFGTPYNGKHRLGDKISVPLKAVALLERAEENSIRPAAAEEVYPRLLQQMYRPSDAAALALSMKLLDKMLENVKLYRLGCNMDIEAAQKAYETMKGR